MRVECLVNEVALNQGSEVTLATGTDNQAQEVGSALMQEARPTKACYPPRLALEAPTDQRQEILADKPGEDRRVEEGLHNGRLLARHVLKAEVRLEGFEEKLNAPTRLVDPRDRLGVEGLDGQVGDVEVVLSRLVVEGSDNPKAFRCLGEPAPVGLLRCAPNVPDSRSRCGFRGTTSRLIAGS